MTDVVEVWRYQGGYSYDYAYGLAVAADNSAFLAGTKYRSAGSGWDYAIVKLDADGDFLWDWQEGSEGDDALLSVTAVVDGVVGSGHCNGIWGGSTSSEGYDFAAVKLYSNGTVAWRWHDGTNEDDYLRAAVETADKNVVVAGFTSGSWSVANNGGSNDVVAAKLNVDNGEVIWRYQAGTTGEKGAYVRTAVARGDGSVVLGGHTYGSFANHFTGDTDAADFLAIAIDKDGNELWRWQGGPGTGFSSFRGIAALDDGSILLAGMTEGDWSGINSGGRDLTVTKLSASGGIAWSWQGGTMFDEQFEGAAIGTDGSVVMSGYTYGSWSATKEEDDDDMDFVAMSMDANGNILWTYQAGTASDDAFSDVAVRPDGYAVLGGWTAGAWTGPEGSDSYAGFAAIVLGTKPLTSSPVSLSAPSPSEPSSPTESGSKPPLDAIIGRLLGGFTLIAVIAACFFAWWRRRKSATAAPSSIQNTAGENISEAGIGREIPQPLFSELIPPYSERGSALQRSCS